MPTHAYRRMEDIERYREIGKKAIQEENERVYNKVENIRDMQYRMMQKFIYGQPIRCGRLKLSWVLIEFRGYY